MDDKTRGGVAGGVLVTLVGAAILTIWEVIKEWDLLRKYFEGRKLVVLGDKETGKTTIHNFLRTSQLPDEILRTKAKEKVPGNKYESDEYKLKIKKGVDVGGTETHIPEWKEIFQTCDICIYTFDVNKLLNDDKQHIDKIKKHTYHIGEWQKERKDRAEIYVFGLFADLVDNYNALDDSGRQNLKEKIEGKARHMFLQIGVTASRFFVGSMKNEAGAKLIVADFLKQYISNPQ